MLLYKLGSLGSFLSSMVVVKVMGVWNFTLCYPSFIKKILLKQLSSMTPTWIIWCFASLCSLIRYRKYLIFKAHLTRQQERVQCFWFCHVTRLITIFPNIKTDSPKLWVTINHFTTISGHFLANPSNIFHKTEALLIQNY